MSRRITEYRMTKSIQQIKQDLNNLESTTAKIAVELENLYENYLNSLSHSAKQQLVLASYQICTQFYPQSFLRLSLSNRQNLQQALRKIGIEIEPALSLIIEQKELDPQPQELNLMAELIKNLPKPKRRKEEKEDSVSEENENKIAEVDFASIKAELEKIEFIELEASSEDELEPENTSSQKLPKQEIDLKNPEHLVLWHKQIERTVKKTLDYTSQKANRCLQDSGIIPDRIPSKIIDVAIQADSNKGGRGSKLKNSPNIIHLAIESEQDKNKSKSPKNIAQVSLLRLRIAELEFGDPLLNAQRGKLRNLMGEISKLNSQYQIIKQESDVAEAQAAWRSSWYED